MKKAAKIFIIIGMVVGCILIVPIVMGIFTLKKMETATTVSELQVWGILDILFCSVVGGILILCMKDSDL